MAWTSTSGKKENTERLRELLSCGHPTESFTTDSFEELRVSSSPLPSSHVDMLPPRRCKHQRARRRHACCNPSASPNLPHLRFCPRYLRTINQKNMILFKYGFETFNLATFKLSGSEQIPTFK